MGRYAVHRTDASEPDVVQAFRDAGCVWQKLHRPLDGVVAIPTPRVWVNVLVEIKTGREPLTDDEQRFFDAWPGPKAIVRGRLDVADLVRVWQEVGR